MSRETANHPPGVTHAVATAAVAALLVLAGCSAVTGPSTAGCGEAAFTLGSQENHIDDFAHLNLTLTSATLKRESASSDRKKVRVDVPDRRVDLVALQGRNVTLFANTSVPDGTYKKTFLSVRNVTGVLANGSRVDVTVERDRLKVKKQFEAEGNATLQFEVAPTVVQRDGGYVVKSTVNAAGCSCC